MSESKNGINSAGKSSSTVSKRKVPSGVTPRDTDMLEEKHQKKSKQSAQQNATKLEYQKPNVNPEPQDYALRLENPQISGMDGSVSNMQRKNQSPDRKGIEGKRMPTIQKVMNEEAVVGSWVTKELNVEKVVKPKLVIGLGAVTSNPQDYTFDCTPLPRKDGNASKMKSRNRSPDWKEIVGNRKPKIEKELEDQIVVNLRATKCSDDAQPSSGPLDRTREAPGASLKNSKTGRNEYVDIGVNAAQDLGNSEYAKSRGVAAQAPAYTLHSADGLEKAGPIGSSSKKTTAIDDFAKILVRPWIAT